MNLPETKEDIIRRFAYNFYQIRDRCHIGGSPKKDWEDAEKAWESYNRVFKKE